MQYLMKKPRDEVGEEKQRGDEFPVHTKMMAAIARHPTMLHQNHTPGCLPWQNGTAKNPQTGWRRNETGSPLPNWRRQQTPELTPEPTPELTPEPRPPLPGTPPTATGNTYSDQPLKIINLPAGYVYLLTFLPGAVSWTPDASAHESEHNTDFDPDMLPDKGTSIG
jgi:hypothetical protein